MFKTQFFIQFISISSRGVEFETCNGQNDVSVGVYNMAPFPTKRKSECMITLFKDDDIFFLYNIQNII